MKRIFISLGLIALILFTACSRDDGFSFPDKARFSVEEIESGISFTATIFNDYAEYSFSKPDELYGLTAITDDGVNYKLTYDGVNVSLFGLSIAVARDFAAATELLKSIGKKNGSIVSAEAEGIYAEAVIANGGMKTLCFTSHTAKRKYLIKTEVSE